MIKKTIFLLLLPCVLLSSCRTWETNKQRANDLFLDRSHDAGKNLGGG